MNTTSLITRRNINHKNHQRLCQLIDELFEHYSRLLVIRVDFGYRKGYSTSQTEIKKDLRRLLNNMRHNHELFEHHITQCISIEYGNEKGWHAHTMFFFDGHNVYQDKYYAQEICYYWQKLITDGMGVAFNCNYKQDDYQRNALGQINWDNAEKIDWLKQNCGDYLCKEDELTKLHNGLDAIHRSARNFLCGQFRAKPTKQGRPRLSAPLPRALTLDLIAFGQVAALLND